MLLNIFLLFFLRALWVVTALVHWGSEGLEQWTQTGGILVNLVKGLKHKSDFSKSECILTCISPDSRTSYGTYMSCPERLCWVTGAPVFPCMSLTDVSPLVPAVAIWVDDSNGEGGGGFCLDLILSLPLSHPGFLMAQLLLGGGCRAGQEPGAGEDARTPCLPIS